MKNLLPALLPALALLTLGGCVGTSGIATTEADGVYYSSKDKTTFTASAAPAASYEEGCAATTDEEAANPDYNEAASSTARTGSDEYYDENYGYSTARVRRSANMPYRGMGLGYYDLAYTDPYFGGGYGGFSPYSSFYDPFYSPYGFGSPFAFGGGSFINIGFGFGNPWARPWRGGYGYGGGYGTGYYDGFYNGYYGGLGGLGYGGLGYGVPVYGNGYSRAYSENRRAVNVAPRRDRSSQAYNLDRATTNNNPVMSTRSRSGNVVSGNNSGVPASAPAPATTTTAGRGRGRILNVPASSPQPTTTPSQPGVIGEATSATPSRRWRTVDPATAAPATAPTYSQPRQEGQQSRRVMRSDQGQQARPQRTYSEQQPTRTYSQPSRSESYSQPSRSDSYSSPSSSPSNSGGSSSGGSRGRIR